MDSSGRMALALSRSYRENDGQRAGESRRARGEPASIAPAARSKRLLLLLGAAVLALIALAPSVAAALL